MFDIHPVQAQKVNRLVWGYKKACNVRACMNKPWSCGARVGCMWADGDEKIIFFGVSHSFSQSVE